MLLEDLHTYYFKILISILISQYFVKYCILIVSKLKSWYRVITIVVVQQFKLLLSCFRCFVDYPTPQLMMMYVQGGPKNGTIFRTSYNSIKY